MEVSHCVALAAAQTLQKYCKERFNKKLGERGCKECIFSAGERSKRCILTVYLENVKGVVEAAEKEVNKNFDKVKAKGTARE